LVPKDFIICSQTTNNSASATTLINSKQYQPKVKDIAVRKTINISRTKTESSHELLNFLHLLKKKVHSGTLLPLHLYLNSKEENIFGFLSVKVSHYKISLVYLCCI